MDNYELHGGCAPITKILRIETEQQKPFEFA